MKRHEWNGTVRPRWTGSGRYGGTRSIGRAIALGLSEAGATVVPASRTREDVEHTVETIEDRGGEALAATVDVTDEESVTECFGTVEDEFGGVDCVVNNADVMPEAAVRRPESVEPAASDATVDVNLRGAFVCARTAVPILDDLSQSTDRLDGRFARFRDVLIPNTTVVTLYQSLIETYPGYGDDHAEAKLHVVESVSTGLPTQFSITDARTHESTQLSTGRCDRSCCTIRGFRLPHNGSDRRERWVVRHAAQAECESANRRGTPRLARQRHFPNWQKVVHRRRPVPGRDRRSC